MTFSTIVFVMLKSFGLCNVGIFSQFSIILWEWSLNLHWKWGNSTHLQNFFRYEFRFCYSLLLRKHFTIKPLTHQPRKWLLQDLSPHFYSLSEFYIFFSLKQAFVEKQCTDILWIFTLPYLAPNFKDVIQY